MMEQNEIVVEAKHPKNKLWMWLKRTFLFILISFFLLLGTGIAIGYFYQDEVKGYIIEEMNKQLVTPIVVDPHNITFSVIKNFPSAAIEFKQVSAANAQTKNSNDTLFYIGAISLQFSIIDIFHKNYTVKKIAIKDAVINIQYNAQGEDNFHFWKTTSTTDTETNFKFQLKTVVLKTVLFKYTDIALNYHHAIAIKRGTINGEFTNDNYSLHADLDTYVNQLTYDNTTYLSNKNVILESELVVAKNEKFNFRNTTIGIEQLNFLVSGEMLVDPKSTKLDIQVKGKDIDVSDLLSLLPEKYKTDLADYKSKGLLYFNATIKGGTGEGEEINTHANFNLNNASLTQHSSNLTLSNIQLKGNYSSEKNGQLSIPSFSVNLDQSIFKGKLELTNFKAPVLAANVNTTIDLNKLKQFMRIDTLETLSGEAVADVVFKGRLPSKNDKEQTTIAYLKAATLSGNLELTNATFRFKESPFLCDSISGTFLFDNSNVFIEKLKGRIADSDFRLKGALRNILPYLFSSDEELFINAKLKSNKIDVSQLLSGNSTTESDTTYELKLSDRLHAELSCSVKELVFNKFIAKNLTADAFLESKVLVLAPLAFNTMDGSFKGEVKVDASNEDKIELLLTANLNQLNINKLFIDLENFGQQTLTDKNIKGYLTAKLKLNSVWSKNLKADIDKLGMLADVKIEKGELNNYEPIKALSRFINVKELENIKFSTLENQIKIKNRLITIPKMEVKNNALNVVCSGTHTFNNELNYHFKILLRELLAKKAVNAKKENEEFGELADDGTTRSLFISMTGTVDNPIVKYDKKGAVEKIKEDIKKEKENIKTILREEFGWFKKDSLKNAKKKEAENTKFKIKWDEDGKTNPEKEEEDF